MVPECPWPRDQGDRTQLWKEKEPGDLPDSNVDQVWSTPAYYWCEGPEDYKRKPTKEAKKNPRTKWNYGTRRNNWGYLRWTGQP